ncbi:MAG: UPF0158 family protein [Candidatus Thermoplasmatota archaeon]|nr:UPF0158 family protein [Candidatus Thermoplasmatota archaeon]
MGVEPIRLAIDIEEVVDAFEEASALQHYFIDTQKSEILFVNEAIGEDCKKQLEEMDDERYLMVPPRRPSDAFIVMELFVYDKIPDETVADQFTEALGKTQPFQNFKALLQSYPDLREQWFAYHRQQLRNEALNWLCANNITLEDQGFLPPITIQELTQRDIDRLDEEVRDYQPVRCMDCGNETGFIRRLFLCSVSPENQLIEQKTQKHMKERFVITHFGWWTGGQSTLLTASRCPQCHSERIIWDY